MSPINWSSDAPNRLSKRRKTTEHHALREDGTIADTLDRAAQEQVQRQSAFAPEKPRRSLSDVVLSDETERQLRVALAKIQHHKKLYQEWGLETIHPEGRGMAINLYGPPGTGKSFAAEGIADHLQRPIIRVNYAQLESRFVGDTPKNIMAAFESAHTHHAVLFFDEADSVLSQRVTNITQAADYGVNVSRSTLLLQLDSFDGVVLFATNLAANYDPAFVRRILSHIHFTLPDQAALVRLWQYHLPAQLPITAEVTPKTLAEYSQGLSGGEILNAVLLAASTAAERGAEALTLLDFNASIEQIRRAKQEIGVNAGF
ncbi:MAG: hypothetical protein OHK0023_12050 [Anaerolineae bacterium]